MLHKQNRFRGLKNVLRFNYPFYLFGIALIIASLVLSSTLEPPYATWAQIFSVLIIAQLALSLRATLQAYDLNGFYEFDWLPRGMPPGARILNISAGFDESTPAIREGNPDAVVQPYDLYDEIRHTEASIRRARRAFPPSADSVRIRSESIPEADGSIDLVCLILAAHEIRDAAERETFFKELTRVLKADGSILLVEHLRNTQNIISYNIGALHFFSRRQWMKAIRTAGLRVVSEDGRNAHIHFLTLQHHSGTHQPTSGS